MTVQEQLKAIKPGKNYPAYAKVTEKDGMVVEFRLNSFFVGMYCELQVNGELAGQLGDHNNKRFVRNLEGDLRRALNRGATVEIGAIRDCKLSP